MANGSRSFHSLNGIEWQSFALLTEWQVNKLLYAIQHSQSAHAIKGIMPERHLMPHPLPPGIVFDTHEQRGYREDY